MTNRPVHFEIHASNPETSIAFYKALFGWRFERYQVPGVYYGVITGDDTERGINGGLLQRLGPPPVEGAPVNSWTVTVDVESVDKTLARALELGGTQALPKMSIPHVGYVAYIKDVDGNIVGLHQNDPGAR
ncbi:MAG: VOC family protein [Hyphomonadaceae bacterium]|nr:VOC family protein [Hyphomonadaceae bacterium]